MISNSTTALWYQISNSVNLRKKYFYSQSHT